MTLNLLLRTLRRRWWAVVAGALLGALAALAVSRLVPTTYEASSTVLVSAPRNADPTDGATYLDSRMPTYAELSTSRPVLERAARALGLSVDRDLLPQRTAAFVPDATSLLVLSGTWADPQGAADLANALADAFTEMAPALDNPHRPLLQVEVLEEAEPPEGKAGLPVVLWLAIGTVLGTTLILLVGLVTTAREDRDRHGAPGHPEGSGRVDPGERPS